MEMLRLGSTEEDQAQETDQSSDGCGRYKRPTLLQHFFHVRVIKAIAISWPWTKDFFLNISVKTTFSQKPLDQLRQLLCVVFLKRKQNKIHVKTTMGRSP